MIRVNALLIAALCAAPVFADEPAAPVPAPAETPAAAPAEPAAAVAAEAPAVVAVAAPGASLEAPRLVPFYQFRLTESSNFPNIGGFFFGNSYATALGGRLRLGETHAMMGAYTLTYSGPALRPSEGHEFKERSMDHQITVGDEWKISPSLKLGSRVNWLSEFRRSGANESFGNGLYDFWSIGLTERLDLSMVEDLPIGAGLTFAAVTFPNYTDLLAEFNSASATSELSGGMQDYNRIRLDGDVQFAGQGRANVAVSMLMYSNAKVIMADGTAGTEAQFDTLFEVGAGWKQPLTGTLKAGLAVEPSVSFLVKRSNQNFLRFRYLGDVTPTFVPKNYDYLAPSVDLPLTFRFASGRQFFLAPGWSMVAYDARPPRDTANVYDFSKTQTNTTWIVSLGYASPLSAFASWTFAYTMQVQQSNNKFERFLPANYTAHVLATSIDLTY